MGPCGRDNRADSSLREDWSAAHFAGSGTIVAQKYRMAKGFQFIRYPTLFQTVSSDELMKKLRRSPKIMHGDMSSTGLKITRRQAIGSINSLIGLLIGLFSLHRATKIFSTDLFT